MDDETDDELDEELDNELGDRLANELDDELNDEIDDEMEAGPIGSWLDVATDDDWRPVTTFTVCSLLPVSRDELLFSDGNVSDEGLGAGAGVTVGAGEGVGGETGAVLSSVTCLGSDWIRILLPDLPGSPLLPVMEADLAILTCACRISWCSAPCMRPTAAASAPITTDGDCFHECSHRCSHAAPDTDHASGTTNDDGEGDGDGDGECEGVV